MNRKKICTAVLAIALCASMTLPAHAVYDPMKAMEEASRQAVAAAVKAGTVPQGTTIYDCGYSTDENGVTVVVRYKDANGNWIDIITQKKTRDMPAGTSSSANKPTEKFSDETLAEYAAEVFRLVNEERKKAGLDAVEWDDEFAVCARIRAEELQYRYSHYRPVEPTAGTDKWPALTHGKEGFYNCPSVADEQGVDYTWIWENIVAQRSTPESAVKSWMDSKGHRDNILKESHTRCGVGVFYTEEKSPEGHNWYWVIWFDE